MLHIFQIDHSQLNLYWSSFVDVESFGMSSHHSGVLKYEYAVGEYYGNEEITVVTNRLHVSVEKNASKMLTPQCDYFTVHTYSDI